MPFMAFCAYYVALLIFVIFGIFILPIGCLITKENLYKGWARSCFGLEFLEH